MPPRALLSCGRRLEGRSLLLQLSSFRVVKDDSKRMPVTGLYAAHTVTQVDTIWSSCSLHGSVADRENHAVSLFQSDDLRAGLHAGALLRQNELAAGEILAWR